MKDSLISTLTNLSTLTNFSPQHARSIAALDEQTSANKGKSACLPAY
jgi:hypothetical protein